MEHIHNAFKFVYDAGATTVGYVGDAGAATVGFFGEVFNSIGGMF